MYARLGVIVMSVSIFLQFLAFLGITNDANFLSRAFNVLHILLHLHAITLIPGQHAAFLRDITPRAPPFLPTQLLVLLQPITALLQAEDVSWVQLSPPVLATLVAWVCLNTIEEGKRGVEALGGLMYEAKGA